MRASIIGGITILVLLIFSLFTPQDSTSNIVMDEKRMTILKLKNLGLALEYIRQDIDTYPNSDIGLNGIYQSWNNSGNWQGPYARKKIPTKDGWGQELIYKFPHDCANNVGSFALYSVGENGIDECLEGDDIYIEQD